MQDEREARLKIVNEIIKEIAGRGRKFFHNDGLVAEISIEKGKFFYKAEYGKTKMICLSVPDYRKPKGWFHGGTLLALVKEFRNYIKDGESPNEFSGLYSPHWAYPDDDMNAIRKKAVELGYLKQGL